MHWDVCVGEDEWNPKGYACMTRGRLEDDGQGKDFGAGSVYSRFCLEFLGTLFSDYCIVFNTVKKIRYWVHMLNLLIKLT